MRIGLLLSMGLLFVGGPSIGAGQAQASTPPPTPIELAVFLGKQPIREDEPSDLLLSLKNVSGGDLAVCCDCDETGTLVVEYSLDTAPTDDRRWRFLARSFYETRFFIATDRVIILPSGHSHLLDVHVSADQFRGAEGCTSVFVRALYRCHQPTEEFIATLSAPFFGDTVVSAPVQVWVDRRGWLQELFGGACGPTHEQPERVPDTGYAH